MDATTFLVSALYVVAIVVLAMAGWGIVQIVGTARSVRRLSDELDTILPGFIERADATLTAFNAELVRINGVVAQFEEVSERVTNTTRAAQEIVEAPAAAVSGLATGARRIFEILFTKRS